jgi:hypothetical protein
MSRNKREGRYAGKFKGYENKSRHRPTGLDGSARIFSCKPARRYGLQSSLQPIYDLLLQSFQQCVSLSA